MYICVWLIALLGISHSLLAQAPQGINFQAVARDASGIPIASQVLTVAFQVQNGTSTTVYHETHIVTTDAYGLFDAVVGKGTVVAGSFPALDWGNNPYQVQIQIDAGTGFVPLGTCAFQSVPYALYAEKANMGLIDLTDVDMTGLTAGQVLSWDGTNWVPANSVSPVWSQNASTAFYNTGRVSIGLNNPQTTLHLADTSNLLIGSDLTGSGFKMIYYGAKGAFRVGFLNNPFGGYNYDKFWDYDSVGYYSFAAGQNARAKGFGAFAFGSFGWADGSGSVAFFGSAKGNNSFTFGGSSKGRGSITFEGVAEEEGGIAMYGYTGGRYGVSIGGGTTGLGASSSREDYAIAIGWNSDARGQASIAMGPSDAYGYNSFSSGWVTEARGNYSFTMGYQTNSYPYASLALGRFNLVTGDSAAWVPTDPILMIGDGTSNNNRSNSFTILKNGQTSVGYNTPIGMLNVSSALGSLNVGGTLDTDNATLLLGTRTNGMAFDANQIEMTGTSDLHLNFNSPTDVRMVEGGGRVGIGQNPTARLSIKQSANTNAGGLRLVSSAANSYWATYYGAGDDLYFTWQGVNKAYISNVNGAYVNLSDYRVKKDIQTLDPVLGKVLQLRPTTYRYKNNLADAPLSVGFIAQEVETLFPELVFESGTYKALSYDQFGVLAIKAIQEQQNLIDQQQKKLTKLEKEVEDMHSELQEIKRLLNK